MQYEQIECTQRSLETEIRWSSIGLSARLLNGLLNVMPLLYGERSVDAVQQGTTVISRGL